MNRDNKFSALWDPSADADQSTMAHSRLVYIGIWLTKYSDLNSVDDDHKVLRRVDVVDNNLSQDYFNLDDHANICNKFNTVMETVNVLFKLYETQLLEWVFMTNLTIVLLVILGWEFLYTLTEFLKNSFIFIVQCTEKHIINLSNRFSVVKIPKIS